MVEHMKVTDKRQEIGYYSGIVVCRSVVLPRKNDHLKNSFPRIVYLQSVNYLPYFNGGDYQVRCGCGGVILPLLSSTLVMIEFTNVPTQLRV